MKFRILAFSNLSDKKLLSKILPIQKNEYVDKFLLFRAKILEDSSIIQIKDINLFKLNNYIYDLYRFIRSFVIIPKFKINAFMGIFFFNHGLIAWILSRIFKKPLILLLTGSDIDFILRTGNHFHIIKDADILIVRGSDTKRTLISLGIKSERIFIVPNLLEMKFEQFPNQKKIYDLIFIGRLADEKRIDTLIYSVFIAKNKYNMENIKLIIVGEGEKRHLAEHLIHELHLNENIILYGETDDIDKLLIQSKVFILTSERDSLPQSMIEALSNGIPCIVSDLPNFRDYLTNYQDSILVSKYDTEGFAEAINTLLIDRELYNKLQTGASKFYEKQKENYSLTNISQIWSEVFQRLSSTKMER